MAAALVVEVVERVMRVARGPATLLASVVALARRELVAVQALVIIQVAQMALLVIPTTGL